jgi:hypothetical protein
MPTVPMPDHRLDQASRTLVEQHFAIQPGEHVLITVDPLADAALVASLSDAVTRCGAKLMTAVIPQLPFQGGLADPYLSDPLAAAAVAADVWLDFTFPYIAGSKLHDAALKAGRVRYGLMNMPDAASFARIYGQVDFAALMDFQMALVEWLDGSAGKEAHVTCPLGTDLRFGLDKVKLKRERVARSPGMHTTPGAQNLYPLDGSARGRTVLQALFDETYRALRRPITVVTDGTVRAIEGGAAEDRPRLDRALRRAAGGEGYGRMIHFTMGFHPAALFTGRHFIEDIRTPGANAVGMGLPWWVPGGGENHPDGVVLDQTLKVEGETIIAEGRFLGPAHLLELHGKLVPLFR